MKTASVLCLALLVLIDCQETIARPCDGAGTRVFLVNGLFNDQKQASVNMEALENSTRSYFAQIRNLSYELAWVEGRPEPLQLAQAMLQRGVDDFQNYWLWLYGLKQPPSWFEEQVQKIVTSPEVLDSTALPRLKKHLEQYSEALMRGERVLIVSHSLGAFYANAALRSLPDYTPAALQPTLLERRRKNPLYPRPDEMIANIQIASPVRETVNSAPWVTFKDDKVIGWIGRLLGVLPGNVSAIGVSPQDLRAHSLIPSYLRVTESRQMIVEHMKKAFERLRYPIALFSPAVTFEYAKSTSERGAKSVRFDFDKIEPWVDKNRFSLRCFDLKPGTVRLSAETIAEEANERGFKIYRYDGSASSAASKTFNFYNTKTFGHWELGSVTVKPGQGAEPLDVEIEESR